MKIHDVTVPLSKDLVVYPGDPRIRITRRASSEGDNGVSHTSRFLFGSHSGTHVDPPSHFIEHGKTVDQLPLDLLMGRARVVEVSAACIDESVLEEFDFTADARILFKTRNSYLWSQKSFVKDYVYVTPGAARKLVTDGIKVVGIDYLSIDKYGDDTYPTHNVLLSSEVIIIEGLDLREVEPGNYEMVCLPLKVHDGDGAPARVVLRES
jgi:arylformamidase